MSEIHEEIEWNIVERHGTQHLYKGDAWVCYLSGLSKDKRSSTEILNLLNKQSFPSKREFTGQDMLRFAEIVYHEQYSRGSKSDKQLLDEYRQRKGIDR